MASGWLRPDRVILLLAAALGIGALTALLTVRWRIETTEVDLAGGRMRVSSRVLGWTYAETDVDSQLEWIARIPLAGDPGERWVPYAESSSGVLTGRQFSRRIGMVHVDALVLARVLYASDAARLAAQVAAIRQADPTEVWKLRGELREAYERSRPRR